MTNDSVECVPSDFDELTAFVVACDLVTCILAIGGNLLVIISVLRYRELRTPTNYFVVALAFADLIVGLNIPFYISFYFNVSYACDFEFCLCRYFLALWGCILSGILMTGVAADRYIAVVHPLRYSVIMTARLAHIVIFVVYVYVSLLVSLPFFWDRATKNSHDMKECDLYFIYTPMYALIGVVIHVLVTLVATIVLYARIFKEAWRQRSVAAFPQINIRQEARTTVMMVGSLVKSSILPFFRLRHILLVDRYRSLINTSHRPSRIVPLLRIVLSLPCKCKIHKMHIATMQNANNFPCFVPNHKAKPIPNWGTIMIH